jgi:hypothetical protein
VSRIQNRMFFLTDHIQGQILLETYRLISRGKSCYSTEHIAVRAFASCLFEIVSPDNKNYSYYPVYCLDASLKHPKH